ncbi:MAG: SRPBCC family protein [Phycicoccus sp.]
MSLPTALTGWWRPPVRRVVQAPAAAVWEVLADGWQYATWVVGAARVREVDRAWPAPGARVHHSFGLWPLTISDSTRVEASEPERRLVLTARGWPAGEARVVIRLDPVDERACEVTIEEDASNGPGLLVPLPVRQAAIVPRNHESLRRLALIAEGRHREQVG